MLLSSFREKTRLRSGADKEQTWIQQTQQLRQSEIIEKKKRTDKAVITDYNQREATGGEVENSKFSLLLFKLIKKKKIFFIIYSLSTNPH